jgi:hypothetical protein
MTAELPLWKLLLMYVCIPIGIMWFVPAVDITLACWAGGPCR